MTNSHQRKLCQILHTLRQLGVYRNDTRWGPHASPETPIRQRQLRCLNALAAAIASENRESFAAAVRKTDESFELLLAKDQPVTAADKAHVDELLELLKQKITYRTS